MKIAAREVDREEAIARTREASAAWLRDRRGPKAPKPPRRHRRTSQAEKEARQVASAHAKRIRAADREARELERLLARVGYLSRRSAQEAEAMLKVQLSWKASSRRKLTTICPRNLYSRLELEIAERRTKTATRSRVASDGFKNIVLSRTMRGFGRRAHGTRAYQFGEAADLTRYILRPDALEPAIVACFTNIVTTHHDDFDGAKAASLGLEEVGHVVAFWDALELFEADVDEDGNVYSHLILPMPHELSPAGRSRALEDFCFRLNALHLPYVAALHQPDAQGDARNFHAHLIVAPRPFHIDGPLAWSLEVGKATELNLTPGIHWLREQAAAAFNHALQWEKAAVRYSGVSQAKRGVASTGETHDGPALTARKRRERQDLMDRAKIVRQIIGHIGRAEVRQSDIGDFIGRERSRPPGQGHVPSALARLQQKFPDRHALARLSNLDFLEFTQADRAADDWYGPAFDLATELRRRGREIVRDRDGQPELIPEALDDRYAALVANPRLPDIVQDALVEAHQRMVQHMAAARRIRVEKERLRRERMTWLRGKPIELFDEGANLLPQFREMFPREVVELDGIRDAMLECHLAAISNRTAGHRRNDVRSTSPVEAQTQSSSPPAGVPPVGQSSPTQTAYGTPEDEAWDQIVDAARKGIGKLPGAPGRGR